MLSSSEDERPWQEPATPIARGAFIVVEGLDRAGKSTQVKRLADELYQSGRNVKTMRFPDRTSPIGTMISSYLQSKTEMEDHAIHLLFSANRWEAANYISDSISKGYNIICDRYYYSGMVYSAAKDNPTLSMEWARTSEVGLPRPDLVIFLNLSSAEAEKRGGFGNEKYETTKMQKRVQELFVQLPEVESDEREDFRVIDAGGTVEEVGKEVLQTVLDRVQQVEEGSTDWKALRKVNKWNGAWNDLQEKKRTYKIE